MPVRGCRERRKQGAAETASQLANPPARPPALWRISFAYINKPYWKVPDAGPFFMEEPMNRHDVHIIRKGGMNLVLDVNSGSLHLFDSRSTQVLEALLDGKPAGDFRDEADLEALQEILSLRDAGRLGTPDD